MIRQLFDKETSTYTYLVADMRSRKALLIDPVDAQVERDLKLLRELELELVYTVETHVHADHVTGSGKLREATGAKSVVSATEGVGCADIPAAHGHRLALGSLELEARATPGHTSGCMSWVLEHEGRTHVFTGDTLLIRGCGRTDFQSGDSTTLYQSVHTQLFSLPDSTVVHPGHDYRGQTHSTIGEEKAHNPRLNREIDQATFVGIMADLKLAPPRMIDVAVPANLSCGRKVEVQGG